MKNKSSEIIEITKEILNSDYLTPPTKKVLQSRIDKKERKILFFDPRSYELLNVICNLLMDQDSNNRMVEIALFIDERLAAEQTDGWRYDSMPPDGEMYILGLNAIDATSTNDYKTKFLYLTKEKQKEILLNIQKGKVDIKIWKKLNPVLFFEELLAETTEIFFSNPFVQTNIKYVGMADAKGWTKLKLNQKENLEKNF